MFNSELASASTGDRFCDWLLMKRTKERAARFWSPLQCVQVFLLLLQCILPFTFFKGQHRQNINFFAFLGPSFTLAILSLLHVGLLFCGRLWCFFWPQRLTYGLAFLLGFSSLLALAAKLSSMELGVPLRVQMFVTNNGAAPWPSSPPSWSSSSRCWSWPCPSCDAAPLACWPCWAGTTRAWWRRARPPTSRCATPPGTRAR